MKKPLLAVVLLCVCNSVYAQFNTIKKIRNLPQIQMDTATVVKAPQGLAPGFQPLNSAFILSDSAKLAQSPYEITLLVSMPLSRNYINSYYGNRTDPISGKTKFHHGLDFNGNSDSVMSVLKGRVRKVAYSRELGNYIEVEHGDYRSIYGHLSYVLVREKQEVIAGTVIGITGTTGRSTGEHLHFALKHKGKTINPTPFLDAIHQTVELQARSRPPSTR